MPRSIRLIPLAALVFLGVTSTAHAQQAPATDAARDQNYVFDDDLLNGDLTAPFGDPVFAGHIRPMRTLLIRPRTSFVPELYKSVENI